MKNDFRAGLLAAALLLPGASFASGPKAVPPAPWIKAKDDARRWTDAVLARTPEPQAAGLGAELETDWSRASGAETAERRLNDKRLVASPRQAAQSQRLLELNLLYVYGAFLPRMLEESVDAAAPGRGRAGGELAPALDDEAYRSRSAELRRALAVPPELVRETPAP
jgi:hypothetical protein